MSRPPYDPRRHHYFAPLMALMTTLERGAGYVVTVHHDDWCSLRRWGGYCDCEPELSIQTAAETLAEETRN